MNVERGLYDPTQPWEKSVRGLCAVAETGDFVDRQWARGELRRMARLADCWVEHRKEQLKAEEAERAAAKESEETS